MEILVKRAIDRSRYPKSMIYVDAQGNICKADKPKPLSPEEKATRQGMRDLARKTKQAEGKVLRNAITAARKQAKESLSVASVESLQEAQKRYADFRKAK